VHNSYGASSFPRCIIIPTVGYRYSYGGLLPQLTSAMVKAPLVCCLLTGVDGCYIT